MLLADDHYECALPECGNTFVKAVHNQIYCSESCKNTMRNYRRNSFIRDVNDVVDDYISLYDRDQEIAGRSEEDLEATLEYLRRENKRLTTEVNKRKNQQHEVVSAVYNAAKQAFSKMDIKPVTPPKAQRSPGTPEIANPFISDLQTGKITPTYNSDILAERMEILADRTIRLTDKERFDHPVPAMHIHALGDLVEGEDIFPTQPFTIDSSLYRQIINCIEIMKAYIQRMLSHFEHIHFVGVIGNHGKLSSRTPYNPETNMDRLVYKFLQMLFENEPRITFNIPEGYGESFFYTVDYIGDYGALLMHGDQFTSIVSNRTIANKVNGWKSGAIPEVFNDIAIGHWHHNVKYTFGDTVFRINGCFPAGEKVITPSGPVNIEDVLVGDQVFSRRGDIEEVEKVWHYSADDIVHLGVMGLSQELNVTPNHKVWAVKTDSPNTMPPGLPQWVDAGLLSPDDWLHVPMISVEHDSYHLLPSVEENALWIEGERFFKVYDVKRSKESVIPVYDLQVSGDHSYIVNGIGVHNSTESTNTYAQEKLATMTRPSQHLQFVHPNRGVTAEYECWLDED